ncbi:MAG TPA: sugar phosphate isomerase/epimerase [Solirubrobacteraceae bacterium]|nr:sugar phosphate isomerase/epimerase [Solirubrobacteraceae bacterium]
MSGELETGRIGLFSACLPGWDSRRVIDVAVSVGFSAIEWGSGPGHAIERPQRGSELRDRCDRAGVLTGGVLVQDPDVTFATPRRAARHVALAVSLGATYLRLFAPRYRGGSLHREQRRAREGVDFIVELAAPHGLVVLVETSPATLAPAPDLAAALVEQHPPERAGVLYDPGNMVIEGHVAPGLAIARLGSRLRHVHVKNVAWSRRAEVWRWRHAGLTQGMLNWRDILAALAAVPYTGRFSIDHLGGVATRARLRTESDQLQGLVVEAFAPHAALDHGPRPEGRQHRG